MDAPDSLIVIGKIAGVYGVKGWVRVKSYTEDPESIVEYQPWFVSQADRKAVMRVDDFRFGEKGCLVSLVGLSDREAAKSWVGAEIAVSRSLLPPLEAGEFYWQDLVGLAVHCVDGALLGWVSHLLETGANDVLVVRGGASAIDDRERLIPYLPGDVIKRIDLEARVIEVDWDKDF